MLKKKQRIKGKIAYIDDMGNGVLLYKDDKVFVRGVLIKEEVEVEIDKRIKMGYVGHVIAIITASKDRCQVACGIYNRCGSCHLMHTSTQYQARIKKQQVISYYQNQKCKVHVQDVVSMVEPYAYRNKIIVGFEKQKDQIRCGFYEEFSHQIIPYQHCLLHPSICDEIIQTITQLMQKFRIEIYNEDTRSGLLRHVLIRYGKVSKEIMVVLVLNSQVFPARKNFVDALRKKHPNITTIIQNVNKRQTSIVLGDDERVLYGPGFILDELCGLKFKISAKSFYQINHDQCETLYKKALSLLNLKGNEVVLDAYCGIGTIGMCAAKDAKKVIGVERNRDAVKDAKENAKKNKINNIHFICDDASEYMMKLAKQHYNLDIVIMDPPRSGSTFEFIKSVAKVGAKKVLYISCDPKTQARDVKLFEKVGYKINSDIIPVDMFPFTNHVESIVLLCK